MSRIVATDVLPSSMEFLEAVYALEQPRDAWFRGVLDAAKISFDRGAGVAFILYDVTTKRPRIEAMDGANLVPGHLELGVRLHRTRAVQSLLMKRYRNSVCTTAADDLKDPDLSRGLYEGYAELGIADQLRINGSDPSGVGCALCVFSKERLQLTSAERELLPRMAMHLSAAYRLMRRLALAGSSHKTDHAILRADGFLEHAESEADSKESRRLLREAVKLREWARSPMARGNAERSTTGWRPLVAGRWSLVDRYERDGRRYIIARENAPVPTGTDTLSVRERQVAALASLGHSNKLIAYQLGLAHSTIRVLLARAATKFGARTREELLERLRSIGWDGSRTGK
jgi:DNA-binding CsgD family transcriptional regulator